MLAGVLGVFGLLTAGWMAWALFVRGAATRARAGEAHARADRAERDHERAITAVLRT